MPLGIRPINDFAFKKVFGTPENRGPLLSLLNAILKPKTPIVDVTLVNPFNLQDFLDNKLSILDIKAVDAAGAIYDIEIQLEVLEGAAERIVFYGCELVAGQLKAGDEYRQLCPVYSIWLLAGTLWPETAQLHHAFRLADKDSGRVLDGTLEIHTVELPKYNLSEQDLSSADELDCWLFWLLHAHEYEPEALAKLLPQPAIRQATETLAQDRGDYRGQSHVRCTRKSDSRPQVGAQRRNQRRRDEGQDRGRDQGQNRGRDQGQDRGRDQGQNRGRDQGQDRIDTHPRGTAFAPSQPPKGNCAL